MNLWLDAQGPGPTLQKRTDLAMKLGLSPNSLKQYYSGRQVPGRNLLNRMVTVLECSPSDLMDDPMRVPAGVDESTWKDSGEAMRAWISEMVELTKGMTPAQREAILAMVKASKSMGG